MGEVIPIDAIQPNTWNPNVMPADIYKALLEDMKAGGLNAIDTISVRPTGDGRYQIINGEHRWKAALELGWKEIRCEVLSVTESEAKAINYRQNRERGTIDPFKEAELFKSELEAGMTQKDIAAKYMVDKSTVSHRLSIFRITPEVKKKLPRDVTVSQLEVIAQLPPEGQKEVAKEAFAYGEKPSPEDLDREVKDWRVQEEKRQELKELLEKAKQKTCPKCKKEPEMIDWRGKPWVRCPSFHTWNVKTGKLEAEALVKEAAKKKKAALPRSQKSKTRLEEFNRGLVALVRKLPSYRSVNSDELDIDFGTDKTSVTVPKGTYRWLNFDIEAKTYTDGSKSKITITGFQEPTKKDWKEINEFLDRIKRRRPGRKPGAPKLKRKGKR